MTVFATGNPNYGIAKALSAQFPGIEWLSRSTGWNLLSIDEVDRAVRHSLQCDVFLNISKLDFFFQTVLAQRIACFWIKNEKAGHIVNVGSTADQSWTHRGPYPAEKVALQHYTHQIHTQWTNGKHQVRMSYLAIGHVDTPTNPHYGDPKVKKMTPEEVAEALLFLVHQPEHLNIEELRMETRHV